MKYARIENGVVIEVFIPQEGFTLEESFPKAFADLFTEVPDNITPHSTVNNKGVWTVAEVPVEPSPAADFPVITPMTFKMLFTSAERIAIKSKVTTDPIIEDWWSIVNEPNLTEVNLNLTSTQEALDYLIEVGVLEEDRKIQILTGQVK
jgi:hypothetical protein